MMAGRRGTGEGRGRRRGRTGGKPGPKVRKQLYATHHGSAGGGPELTQPAAVPVISKLTLVVLVVLVVLGSIGLM